MVIFRLYFNKDKETEFLNEMSRKGWAMTGFAAGFYSFDRCRPGEYCYQVDIGGGLFKVSNNYREFMRDMNVEIVCLWGPWVVLRKKAEEGPFVLYTDVESNIEQYSKIKRMFNVALALELGCALVELVAAAGGGGRWAWAFFCILFAMGLTLARELVRVEGIIAELNERLGVKGIVHTFSRYRNDD